MDAESLGAARYQRLAYRDSDHLCEHLLRNEVGLFHNG